MRRKLSRWTVLRGTVLSWSAIAITLMNTSQGSIAAEVMTTEPSTPEAVAVYSTLPPANDLPEEVARTQIILEARSPVDGRPLSAAEYAELQTQLDGRDRVPLLRPEIRQIIFLLEFRRGIYDLFPFLPE